MFILKWRSFKAIFVIFIFSKETTETVIFWLSELLPFVADRLRQEIDKQVALFTGKGVDSDHVFRLLLSL